MSDILLIGILMVGVFIFGILIGASSLFLITKFILPMRKKQEIKQELNPPLNTPPKIAPNPYANYKQEKKIKTGV